jgi:hypothetical protein
VAVVTELLVLVFILSFVTAFYCKRLIYTQECKPVVSIMTWMVTNPPRQSVARDSAAQISDGKLMSADPKISITCSFRNPEGPTSYTSVDTTRTTANDSIYGEEGFGLPSTTG